MKTTSPAPLRRRAVLALTVLVSFAALAGIARAQRPEMLQRIRIDQKLGAQVPLDLAFRDERGQSVTLAHYFGDKPVILNLAYYRCPMLCNMTRDGLIKTLRTMQLMAGDDFEIATVSFDPREGPALAASAKKTAVKRYGRSGAEAGWHFLTGEASPIKKLCDAVGFRYAWDEETGRYAHGAGIVVLTPQGRVSRYLNGVEFTARDLRLALVEASGNRVGSLTDQVLLLCYQYDPTTGRYGLAIMSALRTGGALTVLLLVGGVALLVRRERRLARARATPEDPA